MSERCETCRFYADTGREELEPRGQCRFNAPGAHQVLEKRWPMVSCATSDADGKVVHKMVRQWGDNGFTLHPVWQSFPGVLPDWWCGEWQAKKEDAK